MASKGKSPARKGFWLDRNGYVLVWVKGRGDVRQHRLVMEEHLGRRLRANEQVHHRNHVKADNRIENLEIKSPGEHIEDHWAEGFYAARVAGQRAPDRPCLECGAVKQCQGRGLCSRCYLRHYQRARRAAMGAKVRKTTPYF